MLKKIEKRQKGDPVKKDSLYLVGEKGPELFSPSMSGMVNKLTTNYRYYKYRMENGSIHGAIEGMGQSVQNIIGTPTQNVENKTENKVDNR